MHIKLELETQPLGNLWQELKRKVKMVIFFGTVLFVNIGIGVLAFSYLPALALKNRHDSDQGLVLAWFITVSITLCLWANVIKGFTEGRQEARRRAALID